METRQKIPVPRHSFLWSLNETSGEILTHVGPTEFTPSANDRIVRANTRRGFEQQARMEARPFILACDGEYVLITNPVVDVPDEEHPNGNWVPGGNKEKSLHLGTTRVIPGPCSFPLWPGQSAEVRQVHKLSANHYLIVEVVGEVDKSAPYYELVRRSAELSSVVIDISEAAEAPSDTEAPEATGSTMRTLRIGRRVVVSGRHTEVFIPPSGIEVVPAIEESESRSSSTGDGVSTLPPPATEELAKLLNQVSGGLTTRQFSVLKNELRHRQDFDSGQRAIMLTALDDAWSARTDQRKRSGRSHSREVIDPYARKAVILGPKNYCILFDADGNMRIVRGPARVFPGPADTFMFRGSRRRVYDAYELGEHQALWLRILSPLSREELRARLPNGTKIGKERYEVGDELLIRGLPSVFFPFIEAEVLNSVTREPHVGNEHDDVVINSIGIDQKSGIYVGDLGTGMVKMIRGETSYLVDPRSEKHVQRRVPAEHWNLWIAHAEPHKKSGRDVVTPWAISVTIPNNEAVLITSRHGRRVAIGPRTELLEYEEQLTALRLSKGRVKDGSAFVTTCFLRIRGGRFCDTLELESSDFVKFKVRLGLSGHFAGDPELWFNVEDPVKLLADTVRARLREAARGEAAVKLMTELPKIVRGVLFSAEGEWSFEQNGMVVEAVDVLQVSIADNTLAETFASVQREAVALQLKDRQLQRRLESTRLRDAIDHEEHQIQRESQKRMSQTTLLESREQHALELQKLLDAAEREDKLQERKQERSERETTFLLRQQQAGTEARAASRLAEAGAESKANAQLNQVREAHAAAMAEIERKTAEALANADATRLQAIQAELVAALHNAADSEVMKAAAQNMNLVALLGGKSPAELLSQVVKGTPLARSTSSMKKRGPSGDA